MKGHIRERGPNAWQIFWEIGKDARNKRCQKTETYYGSKRQAKKQLELRIGETHQGLHRPKSFSPNQTVADHLRDYLKMRAKGRVSARTFQRYEEMIEKHLIQAFGHHSLTELSAEHLERQYDRWSKEGRLDKGEGGLSQRTILHLHRLLHHALKMAKRWKRVSANVAEDVDAPRVRPKEVRCLDADQCIKLLKAAEGSELCVPVLLLMGCGLRRGELLALQWNDVDLDKETITVRHALEKTKAHGITIKLPKNDKISTLPIRPMLSSALRAHKVEQNKRRLAVGEGFKDQGLVFPRYDRKGKHFGGIWDPDTFTSSFRKLVAKAGLKDMGPHALRHTSASLMIAEGANIKEVQDRLRHSTSRLTVDTYGHLMPGQQQEAAEKVEQALRRALAKG